MPGTACGSPAFPQPPAACILSRSMVPTLRTLSALAPAVATSTARTGLRLRLAYTGLMRRLGFGEKAYLLPLSLLIGIVTAFAAVAFHELIVWIREVLYHHWDAEILYGRGVLLLVLFPTLGGLAVGGFSTYLMRSREGHGVVDVIETVIRSSGYIRPLSAVEKILTAAVTIG